MTRLTNLCRDPRISRVIALVLIQYFVAEWIVSASWRGGFTYRHAMSGELGIPFCGAKGDIPCSAIYPVMNVSMAVTGAAIIVIGLCWRVQKWVANPGTTALGVSGAALIVAGIINQQLDYEFHITAMNVFLVFGALGSLLIGASNSTRLPGSGRTVLVVTGAVSAVAFFAYNGGLTSWLGSGGTERAAIYPLLIGLIIAGVRGTAFRAEPDTLAPEAASSDTESIPAADLVTARHSR